MNTYAVRGARTKLTGHYRRPGTRDLFCGRPAGAPNDYAREVKGFKLCTRCVKAEQAERVAAEQTAADRAIDGPTLAERAGMRYALVGTGRRVHYSNNDDTLCGREVTSYTDGLDDRHNALCARCISAAEERAYARALAAASPLAAAAVDLAETVEQADAEQAAPPADESAPAPSFLVDPWTWIRRPSSRAAAQAAEERAERRQPLADSRGANAYPLAVAAVRQVVRELPQAGTLRVRVTEGSPEATLTRDDLHALAYSGHTTAAAVARVRAAVAAHIRHGEREVHLMFPALGMRPALYLPDVMALLNRWEHTQADTEQALADVEAQQAAELVTAAEAVDGTWRGAWIGEQPADDALFTLEPTAEQGALFTPGARVVCADGRERTVERHGEPARVVVEDGAEWIADNCRPATAPAPTVGQQRRAALARIKAKADAERAAHRATTDDAIAAECAAHGVPAPRTVEARIAGRTEQAPARRVVEGVVVEHNGTATGSTPANATHPNVIAARAALDNLAAATLTDHHDVTDPTDDELDVRGYMVDPREGDRVAVYWLEAGRIIRRDQMPHGPALDCLADRLERRGWTVEPMLGSSQCVFAHRPQ
ncbi:hypothetical protein TPA0910_14480 [Streptomyces hygroscopicus subsp. sporocinereus]|uniref:Uncharacterized protein n=1 Tax=Streptomyces hygroscopicus TaxID=1912 RepID=A0ABQ3TUL6_STRHY|nr:hypothetical protein [Streptomyces hygroscopicus]GHJ27015.1 hypothetical protein TPA0910_14480 [Streptomyces hygroscopicus]